MRFCAAVGSAEVRAEERSRPVSYAWNVSSQSEPDAYDMYRHSMADLYDVEDIAEPDRTNFVSHTYGALFENGTIARGRSVAQTLRRTPRTVRASGLDAISLFVLFAPMVGEVEGANVDTPAGSIHFRDLSRPSVAHAHAIDLVNLVVPRIAAPLWMRDGAVHGATILPSNPLGRLLVSHLCLLSEGALTLRHDEGGAAIEAALLIAERALGRHSLPTPDQAASVHATVRHRASAYMKVRLLDPTLTVQDIVEATGVSRTTLFRAFAPGGLRRHMLNLRLDQARAALNGRDPRRQTVAEVAYRHGFASAAHFGRLYRDRFGHAPGEMTGLKVETQSANDAGGSTIRHDLVFSWLRGRRQDAQAA